MEPTARLLPLLLLVGGALGLGHLLAQQDGTPSQQDGAPSQQAIDPELMAKMMRLAQPGEQHAMLQEMVGEWETESELNFPGMPEAMTMRGHSTVKPLLGGRYVMEELHGSMMGMPFEGINIIGYDNSRQEFVSTWMDNSSTWPITSSGHYDEGTKALTLTGTMRDAANLEGRPFRSVSKTLDADHMVMTMYDTVPPQGEVLVMTMHYTRKK